MTDYLTRYEAHVERAAAQGFRPMARAAFIQLAVAIVRGAK